MFHGSIPSSVQQILGSLVKDWKTSDIYIGCSGNFTVERCLSQLTSANLYGNDVTIYSCLLGRYFAGQKVEAWYNEDYSGPMDFVKGYMKDDASIISVCLILSKMAIYLQSKPNPYYTKMIDAYKKQWDKIFEKTYAKISSVKPFLKDFYAGDVCRLVDNIPDGAGFICYPPFYSGDYEKMFKAIESIIGFTPPEYELINKDKIFEMFYKLTKRENFLFGTDDELPEFSEYLVGISQTTNRGVKIYLYSKSKNTRIILPRQKVKSPDIEYLGEDEDVGSNMTLMPLKSENFQAMRSVFMNRYINPGKESASYAVLVDGKMVGVFALSAAPTMSNWDKYLETPTIYLLSDFPISKTKYKRLAKLVLYAALSKETKLLAEGLTNKRIQSLVTTAFSKKPVSMKYRGLFELLNKEQFKEKLVDEKDLSKKYYNEGYKLNYGQKMGEWSLNEGLELWKKNHSQLKRKETK